MQSGQAWGRGVENCCVLRAGRSLLQHRRGDVSVADGESFCTSTWCWTWDPPTPDPSLFALVALFLLFLIGWSKNWRWWQLGPEDRDSGSLPAGKAGLPLSARRQLSQTPAGALLAVS